MVCEEKEETLLNEPQHFWHKIFIRKTRKFRPEKIFRCLLQPESLRHKMKTNLKVFIELICRLNRHMNTASSGFQARDFCGL